MMVCIPEASDLSKSVPKHFQLQNVPKPLDLLQQMTELAEWKVMMEPLDLLLTSGQFLAVRIQGDINTIAVVL